jgi:D-amino-acid dehydrogenase
MVCQVPRFLLDPLGPLAIRPAYLPVLFPWLLRFLASTRPAAYERGIAAIVALQSAALPAWQRLIPLLGLQAHFHERGMLAVFDSAAALARGEDLARRQRAAGFTVDDLDGKQLRQLEPALSAKAHAARLVREVTFVSDPYVVTRAVFDAALARGAQFRRAQVRGIRDGGATVSLALGDGSSLDADRVVVCGGAWSRTLAASLGDRIPLDTERGYNVSFPGVRLMDRPVSYEGYGFVTTPLDTGFRVGGAVEFGGLQAAPNHARTRALHTRARAFIPELPAFESGQQWMGFRPSMPDSLPVIGPSTATPRVIYAFGHGHYGLTQAPLTGEIVAALIQGIPSPIDPTPYRPNRF